MDEIEVGDFVKVEYNFGRTVRTAQGVIQMDEDGITCIKDEDFQLSIFRNTDGYFSNGVIVWEHIKGGKK